MIEIFMQSLLVGYSGAIMPGSLLTYTISKSIKAGTKAGVMISIGHALLELVLVILLFLGVGRFLSTKPAQLTIGLLGGAVLLYFGMSMVKDIVKGKISIDFKNDTDHNTENIIFSSALISLSNPYFIIWWAAIGLGFIMNAYHSFGLVGIILFYLGHILADITWYVFVSFIISKTRHFINLNLYRIVITVLGLSLIGFGIHFIISSVKLMG